MTKNDKLLDDFLKAFDIVDMGRSDENAFCVRIKPKHDDWNGQTASKSVVLKIPRRKG